jgi:hypothetical protein
MLTQTRSFQVVPHLFALKVTLAPWLPLGVFPFKTVLDYRRGLWGRKPGSRHRRGTISTWIHVLQRIRRAGGLCRGDKNGIGSRPTAARRRSTRSRRYVGGGPGSTARWPRLLENAWNASLARPDRSYRICRWSVCERPRRTAASGAACTSRIHEFHRVTRAKDARAVRDCKYQPFACDVWANTNTCNIFYSACSLLTRPVKRQYCPVHKLK